MPKIYIHILHSFGVCKNEIGEGRFIWLQHINSGNLLSHNALINAVLAEVNLLLNAIRSVLDIFEPNLVYRYTMGCSYNVVILVAMATSFGGKIGFHGY